MAKKKIKVGPVFGDPDAPINEIVRHMRLSELTIIGNQLKGIRGIMVMVFHVAKEDLLGEFSEGLTTVLDNTIGNIDELRRTINAETEDEEEERLEKEREAA